LAGLPARPERKRFTSVFPRDPVPPMIRILLPSKHDIFTRPPLLVRRFVIQKIIHELGPSGAHVFGSGLELVSAHSPIATKVVVGSDLDVERVAVSCERQQVVLRYRGSGDLI